MTTKFSEDHEWVRLDGDVVTVGITDFAQNALGDIVFVELPDVGTDFGRGDEMAVVESVKAASEVFAPVSGKIVAVNAALEADPSLVNSDAEGDGWFLKIKLSDESELNGLMDADGYKAFAEASE